LHASLHQVAIGKCTSQLVKVPFFQPVAVEHVLHQLPEMHISGL
jgi:hypothetical protein